MKANNKIPLSLLLLLTAPILTSNAKKIHPERAPVKNVFALQQNNPVDFLKGFFKWYRTMFEYLDHHVQYLDSRNRINFHETERYLSILKSSGFFSDTYINHRRAYFKEIDFTLQQPNQQEGIIEQLGFDFMMHSKDTKPLFDDLDKISLTVVTNTPFNATIKVATPFNENSYLLYYLRKVNAKYLIDKIEFLIGGVVQK